MLIASQVGFAIGFVLLFIWWYIEARQSSFSVSDIIDVLVGVVMPACAIGIIFCSFFLGLTSARQTKEEYYNSIKNYISEQGYTVWINGTEVDMQHITIEDYAQDIITIENEIKEIHIVANTRQ